MTVPVDREEILRSTAVLWDAGSVYEARIPIRQGRVVSGYYDDPEKFATDIVRWHEQANIYVTINPVKPALLARAYNRIEDWAKTTTSDRDILCRRWWPIDFDPERPVGVSSSEQEHETAIRRAQECATWLVSEGVPRDSIISADSGNGAHLLIRMELANTDETRDLIQRCTAAVALRFDDESVHIDLTTYNAARIWKVYGTVACKGDDVTGRPHRLARLRRVPATVG